MTYDYANTSRLTLAQTLPNSQSRQLDWVVYIDLDLLVPFVLGVLPEIGEWWVK